MRPIRRTVGAAGTYYYPVDRYADTTSVTIAVTGLTITSVSYTLDNIRAGGKTGGMPVNMPENGVDAASANWIAVTAGAGGDYVMDKPVDSVRIILGGTGSADITIAQDKIGGG